MKKPVYIRPLTWRFIQRYLADAGNRRSLPAVGYSVGTEPTLEDALRAIAEEPGPLFVSAGGFCHPELIEQTVVADDDGLEYVITPLAARGISQGVPEIVISRLYDQREVRQAPQEVMRWAVANGVFDQLRQ